MKRWMVWIGVEIEASEFPEAFNHTRVIEELVRNPLVRSSIEAQGVRVVQDFVVLQPQEKKP